MMCARCPQPAVEHGHCRGCLSVPSVRRALALPAYVDPDTGKSRIKQRRRERARGPHLCPTCDVIEVRRVVGDVLVGARWYCVRHAREMGVAA